MSWRNRAACAGTDTDLFFDPYRTDEALAICDQCPVVEDCLEYAAWYPGAIRDIQGVWGGKTEEQLQKMRRRTRPRPPTQCGTLAGYRRHQHNDETPCPQCRRAAAEYRREHRRKETA